MSNCEGEAWGHLFPVWKRGNTDSHSSGMLWPFKTWRVTNSFIVQLLIMPQTCQQEVEHLIWRKGEVGEGRLGEIHLQEGVGVTNTLL